MKLKAYKGSPFAIVKKPLFQKGEFHYEITEIATGKFIGYVGAFKKRRDAVATLEAHLIWLEKMGVK
jgi:hypothetical protein